MTPAIQVEGYQLSPQQRRLWPLIRSGAASNALLALSLEGDLDVDTLRRVIEQAVETHETLRTIYAEHRETDTVVQIVSEARFDWRTCTGEWERVWSEEQRQRIDPFQLPQLRATLVQTSTRRHVLVIATSVLAADNRSLENLGSWIARAYNAGESSKPSLQYVQYAEWKNDLQHGSRGSRTDSFESECFRFGLSSKPQEMLLSVWRAVSRRWLGEDTAVAVLDSNREFEELAELIGAFAERTAEGQGDEFVGFSFERPAFRTWEGKVAVLVLRRQSRGERFKLMLQCEERGDELQCELHYDPRRFKRSMIEELAESYELLLNEAVKQPAVPVERLPVVGARAQERTLSFSQTPESPQADTKKRIDELFREQVTRNPNAGAVVFEDQKLTYAELDAASDAVAGYLISRGATLDMPVGICLERSLDLVIAIMGVLKSGAAYVPVDPTFPEQRIETIFADCGAGIVLTNEQMHGAVQHKPETTRAGDPNGLAYIIYTSGSTGAPKGVCVEHSQVTHYLRSLISRHALLAGCNFASVSTVAADLGNTAIFTALLTGGCLHLISRQRATDATQFADYLANHEVDAIKIVPSHFHALADSIDFRSVLPKRCLVFGGEALSRDLTTRSAGLTVINHYGPTETTIGTTTCDLTNSQIQDVPIGRPLPGTQAYLLDDYLQLVPFGVSGELFIGGAGVARGYCNRPDLTAEKFIPDPFGKGQRLYRTGDRARFNENGDLVFEGRRDRQIKIAGFRIELGEVEAAINAHPAVRDAVALVERDNNDSPLIIAYVVGAACEVKDLRDFLTARVPAHLLPAAIHKLDRLPLTANGKLDRAALRELNNHSQVTKKIAEPLDPIARQIRQICLDLINHSDIDVDDNLLDLGVSSLKAMQLLARLRAAFEIALPLSTIFERPTISGLATLVQQRRDEELLREIAQLSDEEVKQRILASHQVS